jgi:hypothetical protein
MKERKLKTLPPTEWLDNILGRDFTEFEPADGDSDEVLAQKETDMAARLEFLDFFVDKMLPTCAGTKMWHSGVRHFEALSDSMCSDGKLRVSPTTEGLCALLYANGRTKWMAMKQWYDDNPNEKKEPPRWHKKRPNENIEFKALYSDPYGGQNQRGGWSPKGRKLHIKYSKLVIAARQKKECREVELACVARLFAQNKSFYDKKESSKKRKAEEMADDSDDEDGDLEWVGLV